MNTRWRLDLEYDGAGFVGWQIQPNGPSIQAALQDAVLAVFRQPARVVASGRTDAGVHAEQQVASFCSSVERSAKSVRDGLNANLPPGIAVVRATIVDSAFDPRRDVKRKSYRYSWLDRPSRSPLRRGQVWHVRGQLDADRMQQACTALVGTHDFSAFRAAGCQSAHPVRTIDTVSVERDGELVHLRIEGNGFLRHMVRIVAGSLWEVGRGVRSQAAFAELLTPLSRSEAGKTAPAHGLTLEWVRYDALDQ